MLDRIPSPFYPTAAVALSLTGMFLLVGIGSPGPDGAADVSEAPLVEAERGPSASGDGAAEGIKVHGYWTIEVREPDGELVTRREFQNALRETGEEILVNALARQRLVGVWGINVGSTSGSNPCTATDGGQIACALRESHLVPSPSPNFFNTLEVGVASETVALTLSGNATAQRDGSVSTVATFVFSCADADASLSSCAESGWDTNFPFTSTSIDPVDVLEGQQILVTVHISFS